MRIIHRIKYKFSEPYRIRIGRGLAPLRNKREYNALIQFCREQLKDKEHMKLNPKRKKIYQATVALHDAKLSQVRMIRLPAHALPGKITVNYSDVYDFVEDHVGWYWS